MRPMRQRMRTPIRRRQLRGLVLHHRRRPAAHPRRPVNRTARWGEPPVNGQLEDALVSLTVSTPTVWRRDSTPTRYSTLSVRYVAVRPTKWTTGWR